MLSSAYFLAKFRFDTAENEPAKNLQTSADLPNFANPNAADPGVALEPERPARALVPKLQAGYLSFPARAASEGWYAPGPGVSVIISWASRRSSRIAANFRGLVLGCTESKFCK